MLIINNYFFVSILIIKSLFSRLCVSFLLLLLIFHIISCQIVNKNIFFFIKKVDSAGLRINTAEKRAQKILNNQ
jgi:hypothetical protein